MIAVHGSFHTKWRRITKRGFEGGRVRKYFFQENVGLEQREVKHIFIESGGKWKAPCGATTKRIMGVETPFEEKIVLFKMIHPCKKCRAWLEKNEASLRMAEAVS